MKEYWGIGRVTFLRPCVSEGFRVLTANACDDSLKCEWVQKNDMVLMIINPHDSQRIFPQISLIILSVPPARVHRILMCVGWWGVVGRGIRKFS